MGFGAVGVQWGIRTPEVGSLASARVGGGGRQDEEMGEVGRFRV